MPIDSPFNVINATDQILMYEPTERGILWIIANNPTAFSPITFMDVLKNKEILQPTTPNNSNKNLSKALPIYIKLHQRGFIKQRKDKPEVKVTWRGQFYRFYTHPALTFWGILITVLIGVATLIVSIVVLLHTETYTPPPETTKQLQQPVYDSVPYNQKKDTSSAIIKKLKH